VCSSFTPELTVLDSKSHQIIKRVPQASPFCPNIAVSPENDEVWITLKDVGKVQVFNAQPPFEQKALFETGPITNHVNFVDNRNGKFAYVTIGGANEVKVFRRGGPTPQLVATIPVGSLPHGIWPSGDGSRVYVALENGEMAAVIDTLTNKVIANIPIGQTTQALVYVPNAAPDGNGPNLMPLGEAGNVTRLHLEAAGTALPKAEASVAINSLGLLDLVQIAAEGLKPRTQYQVCLAESEHIPFGRLVPLAVMNTNPDGAGIVQTIGPLKTLAASSSGEAATQRFLIVTEMHNPSSVVLRQASTSSGP
jgi:YVTN family beta-propeller protein